MGKFRPTTLYITQIPVLTTEKSEKSDIFEVQSRQAIPAILRITLPNSSLLLSKIDGNLVNRMR